MEEQKMNQIPKIELSYEESDDKQESSAFKNPGIPQNLQGMGIMNIQKNKVVNALIEGNNMNTNLYNLNQVSKTPMRRPLDDYQPNTKSPMNKGFQKVKIIKKTPSQNSYFNDNDNIIKDKEKNFNLNKNYDKKYTYNYTNKIMNKLNHENEIKVVKLNNDVQKQNSNNNEDNDNENENIQSKNEEFNNISEIEYEQNNNVSDKEEMMKENENLDIKEDEKENEEDIKDSQSQKQNQEEENFPDNNNIVNNSQNDTLKNNSIKNNNLNYDAQNLNNEENKDSNLQQEEITESAMKRMKNNDGLDEYDNNFNNHDKSYNKMKNIFDE
jgi:hypothetical protein